MVTVTQMQLSVGFVMPDAAQLKSLRKIVAAACSWIGGIEEQSQAADIEFQNAIWAVGRFYRTELPDERRAFGSILDDANQMLIETRDLVKAVRENPKKYLSIKLHIF